MKAIYLRKHKVSQHPNGYGTGEILFYGGCCHIDNRVFVRNQNMTPRHPFLHIPRMVFFEPIIKIVNVEGSYESFHSILARTLGAHNSFSTFSLVPVIGSCKTVRLRVSDPKKLSKKQNWISLHAFVDNFLE